MVPTVDDLHPQKSVTIHVYVPGLKFVAVATVCVPGDHEYVNGAVPPVIPAVKLPLFDPLHIMFVEAVMAAVPPGVNPITA